MWSPSFGFSYQNRCTFPYNPIPATCQTGVPFPTTPYLPRAKPVYLSLLPHTCYVPNRCTFPYYPIPAKCLAPLFFLDWITQIALVRSTDRGAPHDALFYSVMLPACRESCTEHINTLWLKIQLLNVKPLVRVLYSLITRRCPLLSLYTCSVGDRWRSVWSIGGMVLTGENWSTGRETLHSVGGRWMNGYGALVEWYW